MVWVQVLVTVTHKKMCSNMEHVIKIHVANSIKCNCVFSPNAYAIFP